MTDLADDTDAISGGECGPSSSSRLQEIGAKAVAHAARITDVRLECLAAAVAITKMEFPGKMLPGQANKQVRKLASELEQWAWGGFMPIMRPPTPFSTIYEAAEATRERLEELIANCADPEKAENLASTLEYWQRFVAELSAILGEL